MKQLMKLAAAAALGAAASGTIVYAQAGAPQPPKARIALYRAAPGQQVAGVSDITMLKMYLISTLMQVRRAWLRREGIQPVVVKLLGKHRE